ncbi:hypothetical protein VTI74DRAFT_10016 [Chaetomium olivicolor]
MCQPPSNQAIRAMLGPVLTEEVTIERVQPVLSVRPQRRYEVVLSNGRNIHLVLSPPSLWRPLRSEQGTVAAEATAVCWIRETLTLQQLCDRDSSSSSASSTTTKPDLPSAILPYLPTLFHQGQSSSLPDSSYAVYSATTTTTKTTPLALLFPPPSPETQSRLDHQLGVLLRSLAHLSSPTGRFGPLSAVLNTTLPPSYRPIVGGGGGSGGGGVVPPGSSLRGLPGAKVLVEGGLSATGGATTWSVAFHSMLEGVLRDGEDMAVVMGYAAIRRQFRRLGWVLDGVGVARVLVVDGGGGNVLVCEERREGGTEGDNENVGGEGKLRQEEVRGDVDKGVPVKREEEERIGNEADVNRNKTEETSPHETTTHTQQQYHLAGLRDWSPTLFGDPLLSSVFSDPLLPLPSAAFLAGFNNRPLSDNPSPPTPGSSTNPFFPFLQRLDPSLIPSPSTAHIRLLLYQVYHAAVRIVSEFYRPRPDSSAREFEARRKLKEVLGRLAEVPDDGGLGEHGASGKNDEDGDGTWRKKAASGGGYRKGEHPRPEGTMSPAKRIKAEED